MASVKRRKTTDEPEEWPGQSRGARRPLFSIARPSRPAVGHVDLLPDSDPAVETYGPKISFYENPPVSGTITIEEFESAAIARLRVLQELEHSASRKEGRMDYLEALLRKHLPLDQGPIPASSIQEDQRLESMNVRRDVISHFALRLAYRKPNDRQWFINQERKLLETRLAIKRKYDTSAFSTFMTENAIAYEKVGAEEFETHRRSLLRAWRSLPANQIASATFDDSPMRWYLVDFEKALSLVEGRRVFVHRGRAFVHEDDYLTILALHFKNLLTQALDRTFKAFPGHCEERIDALVEGLPSQYLGKDYSVAVETKGGRAKVVNMAEIDQIAKRSFPLCMRHMHGQLRRNHHLKHTARLELGLFLKGIGVTLEDSLDFWRREIAQKYGEDGWRKKGYEYNIRHNYGQNGKRTSYTPFNCSKIISGQVLPGEDHGCPFKHRDAASLATYFREAGLTDAQARGVGALAREDKYTEACRLYYAYTHPYGSEDWVLSHPNQYFEHAEKLHRAGLAGGPAQSASQAQPPL